MTSNIVTGLASPLAKWSQLAADEVSTETYTVMNRRELAVTFDISKGCIAEYSVTPMHIVLASLHLHLDHLVPSSRVVQ